MSISAESLRGYVEYLRDLGVYDFYRRGEPVLSELAAAVIPAAALDAVVAFEVLKPVTIEPSVHLSHTAITVLPPIILRPAEHGDGLKALQTEIGDCTRCPLAYAGRRTVVFGSGDPAARLMFVGEGPGVDEDATGEPFVGKAGQLLNNMIQAMGLRREQVYVANVVMCRPPANREPEPLEANTCSQFLLRQIDLVQPQVVVALGGTAATYLLGTSEPVETLRGGWHECHGVKVAVTYHPAYLLRDPRHKGDAWKDLQRVMVELGLEAPKILAR